MSPMSEISSTISSTSTTAQRRKIKKPLIEKRRRLRINQCLATLKSLVLEATNKDENCFPKMEKADILEMTVDYVKTMKHHSPSSSGSGPMECDDHARTYLSGFRECAMQVCNFLMDESSSAVAGAELRGQLRRHLSGCFQKIEVDLQKQNEGGHVIISPNHQSAKREKRTRYADDRLYSSSSSFSDHSSSSSSSPPVPFSGSSPLEPVLVNSSPPSFKTEIPKKRVSICTAGVPFTLSTTSSAAVLPQDQLRGCATAGLPYHHPTAVVDSTPMHLQTRLGTSHSTVSFRNSFAFIQHPNCLSPRKADEFPMNTTTISPIQLPLKRSRSIATPPTGTVPLVKINPSAIVWRPW